MRMRREFWLRSCRSHGPLYSVTTIDPKGRKHFKADEYFKTVEIKDDEIVISKAEYQEYLRAQADAEVLVKALENIVDDANPDFKFELYCETIDHAKDIARAALAEYREGK